MRKAWLVAHLTYRLGARSGGFLMLTLIVPLLMLVPTVFIIVQQEDSSIPRLGYVDQTGRLSAVTEVDSDGRQIHVERYATVEAAWNAEVDKLIDAYVVVPAGYFEGEAVRYYAKTEANEKTRAVLGTMMRESLEPQLSSDTLKLLADPLGNLSFVSTESGATARNGFALAFRSVFPTLLAVLYGFLIMTNISLIGVAVVREKDQRAMEIVLTSLTPWQLIAGKVMAVVSLTLTQIGLWAAFGSVALYVAITRWAPGEAITVPFDVLTWSLALFLPSYSLFITLGAGVGILAGNARQAQQATSIVGLIAMSPFLMLMTVLETPDSPTAIGLSLFPLTAPVVATLRMGFTTVPLWQLLVAFALILLALLASIWLVSSLFRAAMLVYGQPLRPGAIFRALRGAPQLRPREGTR